jgi:acyl-CoA reductase-like NAD-dependent aldehyde dehydrogenase
VSELLVREPEAARPVDELVVTNPYDSSVIGTLAQHSPDEVDQIVARALRGARVASGMSRHSRAEVLDGAARRIEGRAEEVARLLVREAGKTIRQARKEVSRAVNTLRLSGAEARRNAGEVIPFDAFAGSESRLGWFTREPLGVIAAITPYNDALNLVAHKLGPAIAGGNSVVLKPSQLTPFSARLLVDLLVDAGLPEEVVTVVHGDRELAQAIVAARPIRMVSFTGGFATGAAISATAGLKRLSMELGGNAPVLVFEDADLAAAAEAVVSGAFWAAGQNCIGTQRVLIHRSCYERFQELLVVGTERLVAGDPASELTDVGPMITPGAAAEAKRKIDRAVAAGARVLAGGEVRGSVLQPTVLADVPRSCEVWRDEVFAPIVSIEEFDTTEQAIERANETEYALQAGLFTQDLNRSLSVAEAIEAGGVLINDSSDYRFDAMPFGGAKYGGMGREGVRFAYEEMTQPKVVCINR